MTQTTKRMKMTSILHKDIFQNPITIFFRGEPIRGQQNCPIATIWCKIKLVLTKNSLFIQFFPSKQF